MSNKNAVFKGAIVLVIANFIVKFIGVIYKIPLGNLIAGDGMAYFSAAFEIYSLLLAVSTAGLPVAISKMVAESYALKRYSEVNKIFKVSIITFICVGIVGFIIMYKGSSFFASLIKMPLAELSIKALSPSIFFFCIISVYRGYFQGQNNMNPTAFTQIVEAVTKLVVGIGLTIILLNDGFSSEYLSASAILGTTISTIIATLILALIFNSKINKKRMARNKLRGGDCRTSKELLVDIIKIVIPITIGSLVGNLTGFLDLFLIMDRLVLTGVSSEVAEFAFGAYKGYAFTLFNLPVSIIASVNVTLIPLISAAYALSDRERLQYIIDKSLKIVVLFALPCAVGLMTIPNQILTTLYPSKFEEVAVATPLLASLSFALIWVTLSSLTTVILQSTGKMNLPIVSIIIGSFIKISSSYVLIGIKSIGILGATISTSLCYLSILIINSYYIRKYTNAKINIIDSLCRPIIASISMGIVTFFTYKLLILVPFINVSIATILTIAISGVAYIAFVILTKSVTKEDIDLIVSRKKAT